MAFLTLEVEIRRLGTAFRIGCKARSFPGPAHETRLPVERAQYLEAVAGSLSGVGHSMSRRDQEQCAFLASPRKTSTSCPARTYTETSQTSQTYMDRATQTELCRFPCGAPEFRFQGTWTSWPDTASHLCTS